MQGLLWIIPIVKLTVEKLDNNNNGLIKESIEIDDLLARIEPRLFHDIFILRLSNKVDQRPSTDIVREMDSVLIEPTCPWCYLFCIGKLFISNCSVCSCKVIF